MYITKPTNRQKMRINCVIARFEVKISFRIKLQNGVQFQMELFDRFLMSVDSIEAVQASRKFRANILFFVKKK